MISLLRISIIMSGVKNIIKYTIYVYYVGNVLRGERKKNVTPGP